LDIYIIDFMSMTVIMRFAADPAAWQQYSAANRDQMARIAGEAKAAGCVSHFFAAGNGEVLAVDEWETAEQCQQFFGNQAEIAEVMRGVGATEPPQVVFYQKLDTGGDF
jgi:hypothetical protein